ncbi:hypothetical protein ACLB2K_053488 [Fragaria x ananassa]
MGYPYYSPPPPSSYSPPLPPPPCAPPPSSYPYHSPPPPSTSPTTTPTIPPKLPPPTPSPTTQMVPRPLLPPTPSPTTPTVQPPLPPPSSQALKHLHQVQDTSLNHHFRSRLHILGHPRTPYNPLAPSPQISTHHHKNHRTVYIATFVSLGSIFLLGFLALGLFCMAKKKKKRAAYAPTAAPYAAS